ncbi:MAG: tRNA pseudouridine(55) synthase TruB [Clostridia bacterium]|nr:tRNA pseudouridine(55) synthase TruB [Clostridia bacterium]
MARKGAFSESGIVLVNKPVGISSNAVVNIVKRVLDAKKCGHLGTLDLEGEGLLPVTVNGGTRLFDFFLNKDKTYRATFEFGFETDTLDFAGEVIKRKECHLTREQVEAACKLMLGKYAQMPPLYSAKKVGGRVAYKEALKGNEIELQPKEVEIYDLKVLNEVRENAFEFEISCSSGTYIRSLCRDLAEKMSTYGSMQCILRTRCGIFHLEDTYSLDDVKAGNFDLISCDSVFDFESVMLDEKKTEKLLNGQFLKTNKPNGKYKTYSATKQFLGVSDVIDGSLKLTLRLI